MAADSYTTRGESRAGTQTNPVLTNVTVGNPLQRLTNVGTRGDTGQVATPAGTFTDRPNDVSDND